MNLKTAREYARACGLDTDVEAVNNILAHAMNIFAYEEINDELNELIEDAEVNHDVIICTDCGFAKFGAHTCYMEDKWDKIPQA